MFHNLLVQQGYIVLDMDYRASEGYGRDWRTAIYRRMGHPELEDYLDGVNWMVANQQGDARATSASTAAATAASWPSWRLFRTPDVFVAGAGAAPGHRLDHLQPRVHLEHPQHARSRSGGLQAILADRIRRRPARPPADRARHDRRQRLLPGLGAAGAAPDRAEEGPLGAGLVSARAARLRAAGEPGTTSTGASTSCSSAR